MRGARGCSDGGVYGGAALGGIMVYVVVCEGRVIVEINVEVTGWLGDRHLTRDMRFDLTLDKRSVFHSMRIRSNSETSSHVPTKLPRLFCCT
jgi:hypothetical protein